MNPGRKYPIGSRELDLMKAMKKNAVHVAADVLLWWF